MNRPFWINALVFVGLVALGAVSRLVDAAPNFAAVAAVALFAGFFFSSRLVAAAVPVCAMLFSDAALGWHEPRVMAVVYACLMIPVLFRSSIAPAGRPLFWRSMGAAMVCSIAFFLFTNFAVWAFSPLYTQDAAGLVRCFAAAVPFIRGTIGSDLVFSIALFGGYLLLTRSAAQASHVVQTPQAA
jgi:hypothetical protein